MSRLTPRQQDVLQRRLERAICWNNVPSMYRDEARRNAIAVVKEINEMGSDGKTAERAVTAIADRLEETA